MPTYTLQLGIFTCRKTTTWDRRLYFPSEGRRAKDFFALKVRRLRPCANPQTWVPKTSTLPLDHRSRLTCSLNGVTEANHDQFRRPLPWPWFEKDIFHVLTELTSSVMSEKVKCTLVQALRLCTGRTAHRGSRGIALPFLDHGTRMWWGVSVTLRPLFNPGKNPVPIVQETGWAPRAGLDRCGKSRPHQDSIPGPSSP
jgi:hypothetical protein